MVSPSPQIQARLTPSGMAEGRRIRSSSQVSETSFRKGLASATFDYTLSPKALCSAVARISQSHTTLLTTPLTNFQALYRRVATIRQEQPPPQPLPTVSDFVGYAGEAIVELTDTKSEAGSNLPEIPAFLIYRDAHRGFPPLFRDASNNRHQADPPTQASAPNGVGRFFGFADSAAAFLQQILQHRNSPSLLEQTGDVRAVRMEDYDKKVVYTTARRHAATTEKGT
uniref:EthD domain-containing protein n=1 Tax=Mesocestoides corti TaxID=53468 RepID=A0A5K3FZV5_MESCO